MPVLDWARPLITQEDNYERHSLTWNAISIPLAITISILIYWFTQPAIPLIFFFLFFWFLCSAVVKNAVLKQVDLSLPDIYSIHLCRVLDLSSTIQEERGAQTLQKFDDAVANLVKQIDKDSYELRNNLAASRTVKILTDLRSLVLKFASTVNDPLEANRLVERADVTHEMRSTLELLAENFHTFLGLEHLMNVLTVELEGLARLPEQTIQAPRSRSIMKFIRTWYGLPPPVNIVIFIMFGMAVVWGIIPHFMNIDASSQLNSTIALVSLIFVAYIAQLRKWLEGKFSRK